MKSKFFTPLYCGAFVSLISIVSCMKKETLILAGSESRSQIETQALVSSQSLVAGDTILNVTYNSGTTNSGITGLAPTNATATDAAYIVSTLPGTYHIAHKVTLGDPGYYSDGAYRSESSAGMVANARFFPGDERRYEFSVLLKDWEHWNPANPAYGDNFFQLKVTSSSSEPLRIQTLRNKIIAINTSNRDALITDYRDYINKWIHFRIDAKWAYDNTGYLAIYIKHEGESTWKLVLNRTNYATLAGTTVGEHGYAKWGVYRGSGKDANGNVITSDNVLTRVAYHDNIRIINLPLQ